MFSKYNTTIFAFLAICLIGIYAYFYRPYVVDPFLSRGSDFVSFATAVRISETHGVENVYKRELQSEAQAIIAPEVANNIKGGAIQFNHPPLLLPLFKLVISENYFQSYWIWTAINFVVIVLCAWVSRNILIGAGWEPGSTIYMLIPLVLFFPLQAYLHHGQDLIFVLLGILIMLRSVQLENPILGGFGLGLTTISPHLSIVFAIPWFFSQRKHFNWYVVWGGLFAAFSMWLIGLNGVLDYITVLTQSAGVADNLYAVNKVRMYNLSGLAFRFWRTMPENILSILSFGGYIVGFIYICWAHFTYKTDDFARIMILAGYGIVLGLFLAPHLHSHSLLVMWISLMSWGHYRVKINGRPVVETGILLLLASLIMSPIFIIWLPLRSLFGFVVIFATIFLLHQILARRPGAERSSLALS